MKKRTLVIIIIALFCFTIFTIPVFASAIKQGTPTLKSLITADLFPVGSQAAVGNCSYLNVRRGPGTGYRAFTYLAKGDVITINEYSQKWVLIDTGKGEGWVYAGYVLNDAVRNAASYSAPSAVAASPGQPTPVGLITSDMFPVGSQATVDFCYFLNVRKGPDREYSAFTTVARGDVLTVLEYSQKWVLIDTPKGEGWVYCGYLSNSSVRAAGAGTSSTAVGRPTPVDSLSSGMFPIGSEQTVDYCYFLNVRKGPDREYSAFTYLARGDVVSVLEYSQKWILVDTPKGQGWIYTGYLSRT